MESGEHPDPSRPIPQTRLANAMAVVSLGLLSWGVLPTPTSTTRGPRTTRPSCCWGSVRAWVSWVLLRGCVGWATAPVLIVSPWRAGPWLPSPRWPWSSPLWPCWGRRRYGGSGWRPRSGRRVAGHGHRGHGVRPVLGIVLGGLAAILAGALDRLHPAPDDGADRAGGTHGGRDGRAEVERARAELLGERNHLAREIHDVLAHTLAALSLQLEAFATVVDGEPETSPAVREQLEKTRLLVREGLNEARGAVQALATTPRRWMSSWGGSPHVTTPTSRPPGKSGLSRPRWS